MFKELFPFVFEPGETPRETSSPAAAPRPEPAPRAAEPPMGTFASFEEVYRAAPVKPPAAGYGILKVAEMAGSPHLAGMSVEARRSSLLMALEAAGVDVEDVLQDAMVRQRALNEYEEAQHKKLKDFEVGKAQENAQIQAEMERVTAQYMARIQANLDEIARQQDLFRAWQKQKQHEARRITEAAGICVPPPPPVNGGGLSLLLERAAAGAR